MFNLGVLATCLDGDGRLTPFYFSVLNGDILHQFSLKGHQFHVNCWCWFLLTSCEERDTPWMSIFWSFICCCSLITLFSQFLLILCMCANWVRVPLLDPLRLWEKHESTSKAKAQAGFHQGFGQEFGQGFRKGFRQGFSFRHGFGQFLGKSLNTG